jgi:hypothetical protein
MSDVILYIKEREKKRVSKELFKDILQMKKLEEKTYQASFCFTVLLKTLFSIYIVSVASKGL